MLLSDICAVVEPLGIMVQLGCGSESISVPLPLPDEVPDSPFPMSTTLLLISPALVALMPFRHGVLDHALPPLACISILILQLGTDVLVFSANRR